MRQAYVILNQRSGSSGQDDGVAPRVIDRLRASGFDASVLVVRSGAELHDAVRVAAEGDAELIVAGGGDGTICSVASALTGTGKVLGVLPLGTFNFFARRLNIPLELEPALEVLVSGKDASLHVGEVNGHVFLNNASIGLYPAVLQHRESTYRQLGRSRPAAYLSTALVLLQPPAFLNLRLTADGVPLSRRTPLLFVGANAAQLETFAIPGAGCIDRGRLAAYITRPLGALGLSRLAVRAFFRGLYGAQELEVVCAHELHVEMRPRRIRVAIDGEIRVLATPLTFRWRSQPLRVICGAPPELPSESGTGPNETASDQRDIRAGRP